MKIQGAHDYEGEDAADGHKDFEDEREVQYRNSNSIDNDDLEGNAFIVA